MIDNNGETFKKDYINVELIQTFMKNNKMRKIAFCHYCQISPGSFDKIMSQNLDLDLKILFKVSLAMGVNFCQMFKK